MACLEAFGDDGGLLALAASKVGVDGVEEPRQELQGVGLLLNGELFGAGRHHLLHELVRAHLHAKHTAVMISSASIRCVVTMSWW